MFTASSHHPLFFQAERKFTKAVRGKVQSSYQHSLQEVGELLKKRLDTLKSLKIWLAPASWPEQSSMPVSLPAKSWTSSLNAWRTCHLKNVFRITTPNKLLYINSTGNKQKKAPALGRLTFFFFFQYIVMSIYQHIVYNPISTDLQHHWGGKYS